MDEDSLVALMSTRSRGHAAVVAATVSLVAVALTAWLCVPGWRVAWLVTVGLLWVAPGVIAMARAYREYRSRWPMAFLLGVEATYGRLAAERELVAIRMAGIHPARLALPAVAIAAVLTLFTDFLLADVTPAWTYIQRT